MEHAKSAMLTKSVCNALKANPTSAFCVRRDCISSIQTVLSAIKIARNALKKKDVKHVKMVFIWK